jgi:hypothetical protein
VRPHVWLRRLGLCLRRVGRRRRLGVALVAEEVGEGVALLRCRRLLTLWHLLPVWPLPGRGRGRLPGVRILGSGVLTVLVRGAPVCVRRIRVFRPARAVTGGPAPVAAIRRVHRRSYPCPCSPR